MRVWLGPNWVTFGLEQAGKPEDGKGLGQFDLGNAWRLDQVLYKAMAYDMNVMLTDRFVQHAARPRRIS